MVTSPRSAIRNYRVKTRFKNAKKQYKDALVTLQYSKSDDIEALRASLRHYSVSGAVLKEREQLLGITILFPSVLISYGLIIAAYLELGFGTNFLSGIFAAVASAGISGLLMLPLTIFFKRSVEQSICALILALIIFSVAMVVNHAPHKSWIEIPNISHAARSHNPFIYLILLAAAMATVGALQFMSVLVLVLVSSPGRKRNSSVVIISTLVHILHMIAIRTSKSSDISAKAVICSHLQYAASYVEGGISHALALPDPIARRALQEKLTNSAAYLRELQLWVALAKDEARNDVRDAVAHYIELIAQGKYDSLPAGTLGGVPDSKASKLVRFGQALAVSVVPFACLIGVRYAGLKLSSDFTGWAVIISLAWAAITLISAIDPLYKTRLKDMQDLISAIRGKDQ